MSVCLFLCSLYMATVGGGRAGLVLLVGGPPDASFGFYLREAFQSHTNAEKIYYTYPH